MICDTEQYSRVYMTTIQMTSGYLLFERVEKRHRHINLVNNIQSIFDNVKYKTENL